ncbi:hypothetical protein SADUNF_Sadunf15G0019800 [Salix dunnii]|uniref:Uncharacterized protein n=1 Tax=Salix dunnii TaxID=1413687 RepID=A0A835JD19_9ROSI|nr:hypothetical protein SADUNF_Sadunf15G0019800 [Salix dunnii]
MNPMGSRYHLEQYQFFLNHSNYLAVMDAYNKSPFAAESDVGNNSAASKVGATGGAILVLILILAVIFEIIRRGGCSMNCKVDVNEAPRRGAEEV